MKLIQLNCWGGKLGTPLVNFMQDEDPDFVCLQEGCVIKKRPGSVLLGPDHFLPLDKWPHHTFGFVYSFRYMHEMAKLCNVTVSKTKPAKEEVVYVTGEYKEDLDSLVDDYNVRNYVYTRYETDKGPLNVITHHGNHEPDHKNGGPENSKQIEKIAKFIDTLDGPVIFTGDLNITPSSDSLKPIHERLVDLCVEYELDTTRNELSKRPVEVIDYIFVSKDIKVKKFVASDKIVSDHKALILEFDL